MEVPVVFSTDHNFIMPTGVAILSMLEYSKDCKPLIYIFQSQNVTDEDRINLKSICTGYECDIHFVSLGDSFNEAFEIRGITVATYYRLLIPWILPQYEKVIYCDGDIIFQQSISTIYTFDIKDYYVAGVRTGGFLSASGYRYAKRLDLDADSYINGGVLLINSNLQRELGLKEKFLEHATKKYKYQDQDIVNIVCKNHIGIMPRWFNVTPSFQKEILLRNEFGKVDRNSIAKDIDNNLCENNIGIKTPVIIHFAGAKPWKEFTFYWVNWWNIYSKTPFFDFSLSYKIELNVLNTLPSVRQALISMVKKRYPVIYKFLNKLILR